jgi:amino acid adenylation domain-containing protein
MSGQMVDQTSDSFNLSPQQEQLWIAEPDGPTVRTQAIIALQGALDDAKLEAALRRVVGRHESLRTTFAHQPGLRVPLQVVGEQLDPGFRTLDLRSLAPDERAAELQRLAAQELQEPFDFAAGPLVRAALLSFSDEQSTLVLTISALSADSSSISLLTGELADEYAGTGSLIEDPLQYADFAAWQRELLESTDDEARAAGEFWAAFADVDGVTLPFSQRSSSGFVPEEIEVEVDDALGAAIDAVAARYDVSPSAVAQSAWHAVLARFSGEEEPVTGFLSAERRHQDLDGALGAFARPVPIRARAGGAVTFAELLRAVDEARSEALVRQDYAPPDASPRLAVGFVADEPYAGQGGEVEVALERVLSTGHHFRLWLASVSSQRGLGLRLAFDPECYRSEAVETLGRSLGLVLRAVASDAPAGTLGEIEVLDPAERARLLERFNDTSAPVPAVALHEMISGHASAAPAREAVRDDHDAITYAALDTRANQLAQRLRRSGVGPDACVALCADRSIDMVVGLLGILKAGGAYVPLHSEHPPARLGQQLATAGVNVIVTQEALLPHLPEFSGEVICLDRDRAELDGEASTAPEVAVSADNLAYVIYTSGSTGTPKGVCVTHGNVVNYATDITHRLGADTEPQSFGVVTSISTDLGNTAMFGALCSGGTLILVNPAAAADPGALARQFELTPVDVLKITPSHLGALLAGDDQRVLPRRRLVLGGERAPWDLITRVQALSDVSIINHYGPTETTIGSCTYAVSDGPGEFEPASVPIGRPIANTSCYVLDEHGQPVPVGVPGRLLIGGAGVARGYAADAEQTAERFIADPFGSPGSRVYDTGDLARWLPDGSLEFYGRADEQVKIRGYRVEPAEVEAALRSHPQVLEAVAVTHAGTAGDARLVVYCVVEGTVAQEDLRVHLANWLPEYMLPSAIAIVDSIPRTPSGKVDKLSLPDPDTLAQDDAEYVAPRTALEEAVADIWASVLGVPKVGIEDDFFSLGGHSLLATQVVAQVRSDFAVELPLHSLFSYPTVATLSNEIVQMMGASEEEETAKLMAELEGLSDEEAEQLLAGDVEPPDSGPR